MIDKLKAVSERFDRIEAELSDPAAASDIEKYKRLMRERKNLLPTVEKYREYESVLRSAEEALALSEEEEDREMKDFALSEYHELKRRLPAIEDELRVLLLPRDPDDDKNVVVEIRAGTGGEEAALFAGVLYRMYSMYAAKRGFRVEVVNANETELGGYKEISFIVSGEGAWSRFKFEGGVHRVQRVPETETAGRIHTSAATVATLPEAEDVEIEIDPGDVEIETIKSSGAGGQHINKTESAIRLLHKPTGIVIECQDERSQFKNRDRAMKILRAKLYDMKVREQTEKIAGARRSQVGSGDRSERIRTYNFPQGRVTDHRIGLTLYSLEAFVNGEMDPVIDKLIAADTAEKLKEGI
ncbi:MAG: peptide chain release factor 1 [Clostridia bacterium]|nr:peptide chain release factor 1 [Clostridia bacterium]